MSYAEQNEAFSSEILPTHSGGDATAAWGYESRRGDSTSGALF